MEYNVLTIGLSDELFSNLKNLVARYKLHFIMSSTVQEATRLLGSQRVHAVLKALYLRLTLLYKKIRTCTVLLKKIY